MGEDEKRVDAPPEQPTQDSVSSAPTIARRRGKDKRRPLTLESSVRSLSIKIYAEQMQYGLPFLINAVLTADPKVYQIEMMKHDRDTLTDDFYLPAIEKEHYHILVRLANRQSRRLKTILNLLGIYFRPGIDDEMRDNHALETIDHFDGYTLYLMHETPDAIADGKEPYDITEFISNLTKDEIQNIIDGYAAASTKHRLTHEELVALDEKAYQLSYELKDFNKWYGSQSFDVRSHSKMKTSSFHNFCIVDVFF